MGIVFLLWWCYFVYKHHHLLHQLAVQKFFNDGIYYLETHLIDRVPLYEHYGFEVLEKSKVPGTKDIYLYGMIRRHKEKE